MSSGRKALAGLVGLGVVVAAFCYALRTGFGPLPDPEGCTATADGYTAAISIDQAQNASIIAAVANRRGLPARAASIAIAAAFQESKLANVASGDRDSLGLFQQRPSQGWGTPKQIMNRYYAANAFYDALVKVHGYQTMSITKAAQAVQRSAFPTAYAEHELDGRTIASAMTGYSQAAFTCVVSGQSMAPEPVGANGLTARADAVRRDMAKSFGDLLVGGFQPGGTDAGRLGGSSHDDGRAIDIFFRPVTAASTRNGWVLAHYLVANAQRLHIKHVIFDDRVWTAGDSSAAGWRHYAAPLPNRGLSAATLATLQHRDHVHVDVY